MSAFGDRNIDKKSKKRRYQQSSVGNADWARVQANALIRCVESVTRTGCAIRLGYSRDGGAYAIGIIGDGDPYTVWAANDEELDIRLGELTQAFADS